MAPFWLPMVPNDFRVRDHRCPGQRQIAVPLKLPPQAVTAVDGLAQTHSTTRAAVVRELVLRALEVV